MQIRDMVRVEQRILPVRGLVPVQNVSGTPYRHLDIRRWIRINRSLFKAEKIDLLVNGTIEKSITDLIQFALTLDTQTSIRTDCNTTTDRLPELKEAGLFDVFMCPSDYNNDSFLQWLSACKEQEIPVRLQLQPPLPLDTGTNTIVERIVRSSVVSVNLALWDPFKKNAACENELHSKKTTAYINTLAKGLASHDIETNIIHLPFCLIEKENLDKCLNKTQFFLDHQQYMHLSYELARRLYMRLPIFASMSLLILLERLASFRNVLLDRVMLPFLTHRPSLTLFFEFLNRVTQHIGLFRKTSASIDNSVEAWEKALVKRRARNDMGIPRECKECSLRKICSQQSAEFKRVLPGLEVKTQPGELCVSQMHFCENQLKYYDSIDLERRDLSKEHKELAEKANAIIRNHAPDIEIDSFDYHIDGQWAHQMPGAVGWYSYTNSEKLSTPLKRIKPPCTISVTFGGGVAEYIGFSLHRHCKLLCPMDANTHRLVLHINEDGHYIMLRDGIPVRPTEFEGSHHIPRKIGGVLEPRICIRNIDGLILTQSVFLWLGDKEKAVESSEVDFSVLIVSTRYSRRLQAVMQSLAHQENFDRSRFEVIICYVPGIDAVDDLIDSCNRTYDGIQIVRSPFPERDARSKGFMINESVKLASGKWVILLDSDTLLPPDMFAKLSEVPDDCVFVASDGRKMLNEDTTAKILTGEIRPWESWEELLEGPGEFRLREAFGVPIGFFQCVKRSCFDTITYIELDHFEGSDWFFGRSIRTNCGKEMRLSGSPVLHLDHGGSHWYGTASHK